MPRLHWAAAFWFCDSASSWHYVVAVTRSYIRLTDLLLASDGLFWEFCIANFYNQLCNALASKNGYDSYNIISLCRACLSNFYQGCGLVCSFKNSFSSGGPDVCKRASIFGRRRQNLEVVRSQWDRTLRPPSRISVAIVLKCMEKSMENLNIFGGADDWPTTYPA